MRRLDMTDPSALIAQKADARLACPFAAECHFPRLAVPTASDRVLRQVYCGAEWSQCSVFSLLVHGHEVSPCLWPDGEVKVVEETMAEGDLLNRPD
jgi:hypothetical protein